MHAAQAGLPGLITIATNMAGRGTDIILGGNPKGLAQLSLESAVLEVLLTGAHCSPWACRCNTPSSPATLPCVPTGESASLCDQPIPWAICETFAPQWQYWMMSMRAWLICAVVCVNMLQVRGNMTGCRTENDLEGMPCRWRMRRARVRGGVQRAARRGGDLRRQQHLRRPRRQRPPRAARRAHARAGAPACAHAWMGHSYTC